MSHTFDFRLDKVLELRQERERERAGELARARRDADGARGAMETLEALRREGQARVQRAHANGGSVGMLRNFGLVTELLDEQLREAGRIVREADEAVAKTLEDFRSAAVERQALDRLKDRRRDEWNADRERREQHAMDEAALRRHGRGREITDGDER